MSETTDYKRFDLGDTSLFGVPYGSKEINESLQKSFVSKQTTPTSSPEGTGNGEVGPIRRLNDTITFPRSSGLEAFAMRNTELSKAVNKQRDEIFRGGFPYLEAKVDDPSEEQKSLAESLFRSANSTGQTLHGVLKEAWQDHAQLGVGVLYAKHEYTRYEDVIYEEFDELVRVDPKVVVPVTNKKNQPGGLYACKIHRDEVEPAPFECEECGCVSQEVEFARVKSVGTTDIENVFFPNEIITWAFHKPRLYGRDGLSPVANVWTQAFVLESMREYVSAFYDDESGDKFPNKLAIFSTKNGDALEKNLQEAKDNAQESPYEQGALFLEGVEDFNVEVLDFMSDELLGQSESLRKAYESDIRGTYGLSDVVDGDDDNDSLSRGTKQVELLDRDLRAKREEIENEVLNPIEEVLGLEDWDIVFSPETDAESDEQKVSVKEKAETIAILEESGVEYRIVDGEVEIVDRESDEGEQEQ